MLLLAAARETNAAFATVESAPPLRPITSHALNCRDEELVVAMVDTLGERGWRSYRPEQAVRVIHQRPRGVS
jgi:hypothetical protein